VSLGDLRAGVGAGVRFLSPIGPLRLDIAYGNELKTYISLGQAY
jgi:outer membrane translocation and assembly module TamA